VQSTVTFHDAPEEPVTIGSATIRAAKVTHQGPTVGYRIEEHGRTFVYLPDHEPSMGHSLESRPADWISGHDIAHDADVLLHDAQYRDHEYDAHVGWGHSCIGDTMTFARKSEVDHLVLFHHDPYHTDIELEELLAEARAQPGTTPRVCLAAEGMTISMNGGGVVVGPEGIEPSTVHAGP
jgi:ribonuclease BN (tRNA processing enzyme)